MLCKRKGLILSPGGEIGQGFLCFVTLHLTLKGLPKTYVCLCVHMWVYACFPLRVTHLLIDHSVPHSTEVSMPTQPVARQKMRTHLVQIKGNTFSLGCLFYLAFSEIN